MDPDSPREKRAHVGELAYEREVERLVERVVVGDDRPDTRDNAQAIKHASRLAQAGDFLFAIRVLGDVKVRVNAACDELVRPEDVEQALGDLRRALKAAQPGPEREASEELLEAARTLAADGQWDAAWALIDEADQRLGRPQPRL